MQLTIDNLAQLATDIRNWMYLDNSGKLDPERVVEGADTVEAIDMIFGKYGLRPIEGADDDDITIYEPIKDCEHRDAEDRTCAHPRNMTPECHNYACPLLSHCVS